MNQFSKYQALGNDYIVLDPRSFDIPLTEPRIQRLCNGHFGIGSDGILYGPVDTQDGIPHVRIYNPDGSEAEKSGNGVRIFAKFMFDHGFVSGDSFDIGTRGGIVSVTRNNPGATSITASMGQLDLYGKKEISIGDETYEANIASIGNPHCVIVLDEISKDLVVEIGPIVEHHDLFPNRTNVQLVEVIDRNNIRLEIWERGVGYTLASGTSSAAAAGVCYNLGYVDNEITAHMPGGNLDIIVQENLKILQTGEVHQTIRNGKLSEEFIQQLLELD